MAEELAEALARDVIAAQKELGDEELVNDVSKLLEASSTTMQEAFLTAARVLISEERARKMLDQRLDAALKAARAAQDPPA
ncbi:hypothetical protein [Pseudaestuariivita atlantica]|nr:hypothetical protein [Pseudaestuariivita atlantica]